MRQQKKAKVTEARPARILVVEDEPNMVAGCFFVSEDMVKRSD
jgi:hypothetical protein